MCKYRSLMRIRISRLALQPYLHIATLIWNDSEMGGHTSAVSGQQLDKHSPAATKGYRIKPGSSHVGFVVDKVTVGEGFLRVLGFLLPIFIPPISPQSPSPIIRGWYNRPVVAAVPKVPLN
jgi:hypothetical protein